MNDSRVLKALTDAARAPLSDWPTHYPDHQAIGYLCSYVPEEMIHAAGFTPVRLRGTTTALRQVDAHLQSFTCALCRSTLDQVLLGNLGFLSGTIFAHTCDAMQAQADLWRMNTPASHFVETVMQPANLGTPAARTYLIAELDRFRGKLASLIGRPISAKGLQSSIALYDETRRLVRKLEGTRDRLGSRTFYDILDAAQVMPREFFNPLLAELLAMPERDSVRDRQGREDRGPGLFLAGAVLDEPRLLDLIEEVGAQVVGDDLCSGSRHFHEQVGVEGDPVANLADYYLRRPPCPTKFHPTHDPGAYLLEQVTRVRAEGVVFALEKFCEPHAFDYGLIRSALEDVGVPHLMLEMEQTPSLEALRTRLEAFVEML
ncbi:MAG: 2-hydroxyacyl-CoA dehydratase family protein [Anaerolineae bacterium]